MTYCNSERFTAFVFTVIAFIAVACFKYSAYAAEDSTVAASRKNESSVMSKSPVGAALRSIVLPGWGQYYVEKYWKIPIFLGAAGTCAYIIIDNNKSFNDKVKQIKSAAAANPEDPYIDLYKRQREVYRDNRDRAAFIIAGVYILSAIDAYVDAHLFDFNVDDNISVNVAPPLGINFARIKLSVKF